MKTQLYSVFDTASGVYSKPIFARADGEVSREFQTLCTKADHPYADHPEDYSLIRCGIFDDSTGMLTNEANETLCTGLEVVALSRNVRRDNLELALDIPDNPGGSA